MARRVAAQMAESERQAAALQAAAGESARALHEYQGENKRHAAALVEAAARSAALEGDLAAARKENEALTAMCGELMTRLEVNMPPPA